MAPRANSGLEGHAEKIIGDSPLLEIYQNNHPNNTTAAPDHLEEEEESGEKISIIIGLVVALLLAVFIVVICASIIKRMRRRQVLPAPGGDGKGIEMRRVKSGKGQQDMPDGDLRTGSATPSALPDPFVQFAHIPPDKGVKLWKGRVRVMKRHFRRTLLNKQVAIHGCTIPDHCRDQLKRIYVY